MQYKIASGDEEMVDFGAMDSYLESHPTAFGLGYRTSFSFVAEKPFKKKKV